MERFRGRNSVGNVHYKNVISAARPVVTSSLLTPDTAGAGDIYHVTVVVPSGIGAGATGVYRPTVWQYYMSTDTDGFIPTASAIFSAAAQGSTVTGGGVFPSSTLNFTRGLLVTNSTGHVIANFTATTGTGTTQYLHLVTRDGQRVAAVQIIITT
jgi:hypothetical protein